METLAQDLEQIVERWASILSDISAEKAAEKPLPGKWSKKEILGHLIDSAANNQQKFVRTMLGGAEPVEFVGYEQDAWVSRQFYQQRNWPSIISLWVNYNLHLAHLIRHVDPEKLDNSIRVSGNGPYTLRFMMSDYVEHLKHHLLQIGPDPKLRSSFSMTPYV